MAAVVATAFDQHPATMEHLALLLAHRHRHAFERTFGPDAVRVLEAAVRRMGTGWVSEWTLDFKLGRPTSRVRDLGIRNCRDPGGKSGSATVARHVP